MFNIPSPVPERDFSDEEERLMNRENYTFKYLHRESSVLLVGMKLYT